MVLFRNDFVLGRKRLSIAEDVNPLSLLDTEVDESDRFRLPKATVRSPSSKVFVAFANPAEQFDIIRDPCQVDLA